MKYYFKFIKWGIIKCLAKMYQILVIRQTLKNDERCVVMNGSKYVGTIKIKILYTEIYQNWF